MQIDLTFPVAGKTLPTDHAYSLFASLSHRIRDFHQENGGLRFAPITGERCENGILQIGKFSRLRVRLDAEKIPLLLALTGQSLEVGQNLIRLGPPTVLPLVPAPTLFARTVTFKYSTPRPEHRRKPKQMLLVKTLQSEAGYGPEAFLRMASEKLRQMSINGIPSIPVFIDGARQGQPRRKIIRIKGKAIVGYSLLIEGLTAEESILLQETGIGGRTRIGCGFFLPHTEQMS